MTCISLSTVEIFLAPLGMSSRPSVRYFRSTFVATWIKKSSGLEMMLPRTSSGVKAPRKKPMAPRVRPRTMPIASSWRMTRSQLVGVTCPRARARVMSVAACDPELPPVEMHNGTNRASTTTALMASSKWDKAVKVNSSATNRQASQKARLCHSVKKFISR